MAVVTSPPPSSNDTTTKDPHHHNDDDQTGKTTAVAVPVGKDIGDDDDDDDMDTKLGRSCCGCCCDMRRAVFILSILGIIFACTAYVGNLFTLFLEAKDDEANKDDQDTLDRIDQLNIIHIIMTCISVICYTLAIIGSVRYDTRLVSINAAYVLVHFVVTVVLFISASNDIEGFEYGAANIIGPAIGTTMTIYVNKSFVREVKCGIMSAETYDKREKQSCCCV